jgi:pyrrolidone-carboxylate peptidase
MPPVFVTAFGPFETVADNPSSVLAEQLGVCEILDLNLEVSLEGVDQAVSRYLKSFPPRTIRERPILLLLGVNAASLNLQVEHRAKNKMNFPLPDVSGHLIRDRVIIEDYPAELKTSVDVHVLVSEINEPRLKFSEDAGEFICNFMYYKSLALLDERFTVLFVHVVKFDVIPETVQLEILNALVRLLSTNESASLPRAA